MAHATGPEHGEGAARRAALIDLLRFYAEAGVDVALDEAPHDRLAEGAAERAALANRRAAASPPAGMTRMESEPGRHAPSGEAAERVSAPLRRDVAHDIAPDAAASSARSLAAAATTLAELRDAMDRFEGCGLKATASRLVFGDGQAGARLMLIGEAPGREEDRSGTPFVGPAGQLLDRMLGAIGLTRGEVYIANVIPWRPPGNRTPTPQEVAICLPFLLRQIALVGPEIVVCLGAPSTQALLEPEARILSVRGRWYRFESEDRVLRAMPMLHPAYLLRTPDAKRHAYQDLLTLRQALDGLLGTEPSVAGDAS